MPSFPFDFELPPERIAQEPVSPRDRARLLLVDRGHGTLAHHHVADLPELLRPGDLLVLNDTRVVPARLLGQREKTGGRWEGLFLRALPDGSWEMLCQTRGKLREEEVIRVATETTAGETLCLQLVARLPQGRWQVKPLQAGATWELLERYGQVPLPPYIRKGRAAPGDREHYQTIYARHAGAVAAPTAGLHFTPELFERLQQRGIERTYVTLHVGPGTFQPVQTEDFAQHQMHREWGELGETAVRAIERCKQRGGRVIAVGTTSVRVLESVAAAGALRPWSGETDLFIRPPYQFGVVDALLTNFHLPRTTLLLLVCAFAGSKLTQQAYEAAIAERYRFFSYGDAMLIV